MDEKKFRENYSELMDFAESGVDIYASEHYEKMVESNVSKSLEDAMIDVVRMQLAEEKFSYLKKNKDIMKNEYLWDAQLSFDGLEFLKWKLNGYSGTERHQILIEMLTQVKEMLKKQKLTELELMEMVRTSTNDLEKQLVESTKELAILLLSQSDMQNMDIQASGNREKVNYGADAIDAAIAAAYLSGTEFQQAPDVAVVTTMGASAISDEYNDGSSIEEILLMIGYFALFIAVVVVLSILALAIVASFMGVCELALTNAMWGFINWANFIKFFQSCLTAVIIELKVFTGVGIVGLVSLAFGKVIEWRKARISMYKNKKVNTITNNLLENENQNEEKNQNEENNEDEGENLEEFEDEDDFQYVY